MQRTKEDMESESIPAIFTRLISESAGDKKSRLSVKFAGDPLSHNVHLDEDCVYKGILYAMSLRLAQESEIEIGFASF